MANGDPPNPPPVNVALNPPNGTVTNTVTTPPVRVIRYAQGIDMHPGDHHFSYDFPAVVMDRDRGRYATELPAGLASLPFLDLQPNNPDAMVHTYRDPGSGVTFELHRTFDKAVFREWLRDPEALVIYAGHCRHGRGPCFGPGRTAPGEDFQNGDGTHSGLFRMGFQFIGIPALELIEYGYTADLYYFDGVPTAATPVPRLDPDECAPPLRDRLGTLRWVSLDVALREARGLPFLPQHAVPINTEWGLASPPAALNGRWALGYRHTSHGVRQWHFVHVAGWMGTNMANFQMDLGESRPRCRMFVFIGCRSSPLIGPIFRDTHRLNWQEHNDRNIAWFLSETGFIFIGYYFFHHLVTAPLSVLNGSWHDWSRYAVDRANATARLDSVTEHYQLECPGGCTI